MARYRFVIELDVKKTELTLTLIAKKYNFISPNFKVPDK